VILEISEDLLFLRAAQVSFPFSIEYSLSVLLTIEYLPFSLLAALETLAFRHKFN
jgi:hypothetical protein